MSDVHTQVVALLNELHASTRKVDKVNRLRDVEEFVVRKDPGLLDSFFDELIQTQTDAEPAVRVQLISLLEAACLQDTAIIARALPTLEYLLADETPVVVKRAVRCCANITRQCFAQAAPHGINRHPSHEAAWAACIKLKAQVLALRADKNPGVSSHVFHFMETLVLLFSYRTRGSVGTQQTDASLDLVAPEHPFLNTAKLRKQGRILFSTLVTSLLASHDISSVLAGTITTSLTSIAERRPVFMGPVLATLVRILDEPPIHFSMSAVRSMRRTLRAQLLILFKHEASAEFHDELVPRLEGLGVAQRDINDYDKRSEVRARPLDGFLPKDIETAVAADEAVVDEDEKMQGEETKEQEGGGEGEGEGGGEGEGEEKKEEEKKEEEGEEQLSALEKAAQEQMAKYPFEKLKATLSLDSLVDLVITSLLALPDELPTGDAELTARAHRAPKHETRQTERQRGDVREAIRKDEVETSLAPALPMAPRPDNKPKKTKPVVTPSRPGAKRFALRPVTLSAAAKQRLCMAAFRRILNSACNGGRRGVRARMSTFATVACQMLSGQAVDGAAVKGTDPMTKETLEVVGSNPVARADFINTWLFHEWWQAVQRQQQGDGNSDVGAGGVGDSREKETARVKEEEEVGDQASQQASGGGGGGGGGDGGESVVAKEEAPVHMDTSTDATTTTTAAAASSALGKQNSGGSGQSDGVFGRYDACAMACLQALLTQLPMSEAAVTRLLSDCPRVSSAMVANVTAIIPTDESDEDDPQLRFALLTLRSLALKREDCREACLQALLSSCTSRSETLGTAATSTSLQLFETAPEAMRDSILSFAENAMLAALRTTEVDQAAKTAVAAQCRLFFQLVLTRVHKFNSLVQGYATATPSAKRALLSILQHPVSEMRRREPTAFFEALLHFPHNAESLVLRALHTICDAEEAKRKVSAEARACAMALYEKTHDVRFLIPIISALTQTQLEDHLAEFLSLPARVVKQVMQRLLKPTCRLDPPTLLLQLHKLEPAGALKISNIIVAVDACFQRRDVYTQPLLSTVLEQLAELSPPPRLLMRTVIQTLHSYQGLKRFVVKTVFPPFMRREQWQDDNLLKGFVKCVELTMPEAAQFLEKQDAAKLRALIKASPDLAAQLKTYCGEHTDSPLAKLVQA